MRDTFVTCLVERARADRRIYLITPDMGYSVLEPFANEFPERFLNAGIAEQNAVGIAAGLALSGKVVYVYSIIPFVTMRCYEQIRVDVAYMNTDVRLVGVGAGLTYGAAGATHHAIEDISIMRALPNMTVCCPGDPVETRALITESFERRGPIYFRLGKRGERRIHPEGSCIRIGGICKLTSGADLALLATSNMLDQAERWTTHWAAKGKRIALYSVHTIKPFDSPVVEGLIASGVPIATLEEHNIVGGLGSAVAEVIAESGRGVRFMRIGIADAYSHYIGGHEYLREKFSLSDPEQLGKLFDP